MRQLFILLFFTAFHLTGHAQAEEARLLRFPAVHGNQIVFTYAGDLYTVARSGGTARRLTQHDGFEMFARFSPDGKNIAFTGQYDGNTEVFRIPAEGGQPQRLTYTATLGRDDISDRMGPNNIVMTWKDNSTVVFRSRKQSFNSFKGQLFSVNSKGGLSEELPFAVGSWISYSPDGKKIAMNQVFREFRTWKYYKGGMADDIWVYDPASKNLENITNNPAQDIFPMWHGNKIYFFSDRDRRMNLFSYDTGSKEIKKETTFEEFDCKFPSLGDDAIAFENGGYVYLYEFSTGKAKKISIQIRNDFGESGDVWVDAKDNLRGGSLSPSAKRVVVNARGEIFNVPVKEGVTYNLTQSSGNHDRNGAWSPDGEYIAYISDKTGEDEIYIQPSKGGEATQLTRKADTYYYGLSWSPDSKKILFADRELRLRYVEVASKKIKEVDNTDAEMIRSYTWSPDSRWIAYSKPEWQSMSRIWLHNVSSSKNTPITEKWYSSTRPDFSPDGKYLFFSSNRDFSPSYSRVEWNHAYFDMGRPYFLALAKDTPSPLALENPREQEDEKLKEEEKEDDKEKDEDSGPAPIKVDLDGITDRVNGLPLDRGNYWNISVVGNKVYYIFASQSERPKMKLYDLKAKKEKELCDCRGFSLNAKRNKMLIYQNGGNLAVVSPPESPLKVSEFVDLSGLKVKINKAEEWEQIFNEAHRQYRYFFYAPNMHGVDWDKMKKKYSQLLPHVRHRADLTYVIGELIGEVNVGHAYVGGGDRPQPERTPMGLLGAKLSRDASGYYRIDRILKGENWTYNGRSPLTEIGVDASEGDYIISIDGNSTKDLANVYAALAGKANKMVELELNSSASASGSRKVLVKPIDDESRLYYYNWVRENIRKVDEASNGKVGYIHIPDMGSNGLNEFIKHFYPQLNKKALIIDDRGNGGGNVSPHIIERLNREMVMVNYTRNMRSGTNPYEMLYGPKVLLVDQYSASDGDLFPFRFKALNMGPVIGKRSWGGVIGYRGQFGLIDGGYLVRPEFGPYSVDGKEWIIEGTGVSPTIEVANDPAKEYAGEDEQLNRAIEEIMKLLKTEEKEVPPPPPYPKR